MKLEKSIATKIIALHNEVNDAFKLTLDKAIEIGELLIEQRKELKHGEFLSWVKDNLPFTDRTARNYIKLFNNKDKLITETVSDLSSAYKLLTPPKSASDDWHQFIMEVHKRTKEILAQNNSVSELKQLIDVLTPLAQDCGLLVLETGAKIGELIGASEFKDFPDAKELFEIIEKIQSGTELDITKEKHNRVVEFLSFLHNNKEFWIGDWALYGEQRGFTS